MLTSGQLRDRVTLLVPADSTGDRGQDVVTFNDGVTVWAEVLGTPGRETETAGQTGASAAFRVRVRYDDGLTSRHRLRWGTRVLEIVGPPADPDGRRRELLLDCREHNP